jgi:Na+-translocating ferredoxin:NAD+ oxidoreductase subunit G
MKEILKIGFILFLFCAIASGVLAFVNKLTKEKIAQNKQLTEGSARADVVPEGKLEGPFIANAGKPDSLVYYTKKSEDGKVDGFTFVAAGRGYSSTVKTMVAVTSDYTIQKIKVIEQNETPGLGANCLNADFPSKFANLKMSELAVDKDGGKIKSISGATITTRAITKSIASALKILKAEAEANPNATPIASNSSKPVADPFLATEVNKEVNKIANEKAEAKKPVTDLAARKEVMPNVKFEGPFTVNAGKSPIVYYAGKGNDGKVKGYTFVASGKGYSSTIKTMVAVNTAFKVTKIKVLQQNETPGLGANCLNDEFGACFVNKSLDDLVVVEDGGKIQSITSATITSRAITNSIHKALLTLKNEIQKNPVKDTKSGGSL